MKRSIWVVAVLLLLLGSGWMTVHASDAAATIKEMEEKWAAAASKNDDATVAAMLADSLTAIGSDGKMRNRSEMLAAMKGRKYESATEEDIKVQVHGDAAVATGVWRAKGTENGKAFDEVERFTDTYVKIDGKWKCIATQSSTIK